MAINKKFIHFKRKSTFQRELEAGNILNTSIVFIADAKQIYLNGSYFSENTLFNLSDLLSTVSGDLTDTDTSNEAIVKLYKYLKEVDSNTDSLIKVLMQEVSTLEETLTNRIDSTDLLVATELSNINQRLNTSENEITRLSESFKETDSITKILVEEVPSIEQTLTNRIDNTDLLVATELGNINQKLDNIENLINITYSGLKSLRDSSKLVPGRWYRITDYECTTSASGTSSAHHQFDIVVLALSNNNLSEEARAIQHEEDTYFANNNLLAWKIWYTIDNDNTKYSWADTVNGKGVIYRMIDELNNDCPYDFKNVLFARWLCEDTVNGDMFEELDNLYLYWNTKVESGFTLNKVTPISVDSTQRKFLYTFSTTSDTDNSLNSTSCRDNVITANSQYPISLSNIVIIGTATNNVLYKCSNISALEGFTRNRLDTCTNIIIGKAFDLNKIGVNSSYLIFGNSCSYNDFGRDCNYSHFFKSQWGNVFNASSYYFNSFGPNFAENVLGMSCGANKFEAGCGGNFLYADCEGNTFKENSSNNILYRNCDGLVINGSYNKFGAFCSSITINGNGNKFGDTCSNMTFPSLLCNENSFGDNCSNNTFKNYLSYNKFGNGFSSNTIGTSVQSGAEYNTFGDNISSVTIGNKFKNNTVNNFLQQVTIGDNISNTVIFLEGQLNNITLDITPNANYLQYVAKTSSGQIKVWNPADLNVIAE